MVSGGLAGYGFTVLDTTEVFQDNEWRTVRGKLPQTMHAMKATTINGKILLFGNIYYIINYGVGCSLFFKF